MGETLEALRDLGIWLEVWGLSNKLDRIREDQWLLAGRIATGVDAVAEEVHGLRGDLQHFRSSLERRLDRLDQRLDFQNHLIARFIDALYRPIDTEARELRARGERELLRGHYDEALAEFDRAVALNPYDFTCQYNAAAIYLEHLGDDELAWDACERVLRYTEPHPNPDQSQAYFASRALVLMARMLEEGGLLEPALVYYGTACRASPDYSECFIAYGRVASTLGHERLALGAITVALLLDDEAMDAVLKEAAFASLGARFQSLISQHKIEAASRARAVHDLSATGINRALSASGLERSASEPSGLVVTDASAWTDRMVRDLEKTESRLKSNGYFDAVWCSHVDWENVTELESRREQLQQKSSALIVRATKGAEYAQEERLRAIKDNERSALAKTGEAFPWWLRLLLFPAWMAAVFGGIALIASEGGSVPAGVALMIAGVAVPWVIKTGLESAARSSALEQAAAASGRATHSTRELRTALESVAKSRGRALAEVEKAFTQAWALLHDSRIACHIILIDPRPNRDDYDEGDLATGLRDLVREWRRDAGSFSLEEAKEVIRKAPRILVEDIALPDALGMASFLRRRFGVSVGIKRRYAGRFRTVHPHPLRSA